MRGFSTAQGVDTLNPTLFKSQLHMHPSLISQKKWSITMSFLGQKNLSLPCMLKENKRYLLGSQPQAPTSLSCLMIPLLPVHDLHRATLGSVCTPYFPRALLMLVPLLPPVSFEHSPTLRSSSQMAAPLWNLQLSGRNVISSTFQFHSSLKPSSRACSFCLPSQLPVGLPILLETQGRQVSYLLSSVPTVTQCTCSMSIYWIVILLFQSFRRPENMLHYKAKIKLY